MRINTYILVACLWLTTSSLQGKILFNSDRDGNIEVYTMNSDGSNQTRLTFNKANDRGHTWSPNGQQIAFDRDDFENPDVYVMDADGRNERRLTDHLTYDGSPCWSSDGSLIAFESSHNERLNIFLMQPDGTNIKQVTDFWFVSRPKWSPDGKQIAFEGFIGGEIGDTREIYAIKPDGTGLWQVSEPEPNTAMFLGGWSPDGTQILYAAAIEGLAAKSTFVIVTLHPFGRNKVFKRERIRIPGMSIYSQSFGADGESILFSGQPVAAFHQHIYRFQLDTHELIQLTDGLGNNGSPQEWNPRLSVRPSRVLPLFWGEVKSGLLR